MKTSENLLLNLSPLWRTILSLLGAAAVFLPVYHAGENLLFSGVAAWVAFSFVFLIFSWYIIIKRPVEEIKRKANEDDGSVAFVFIMIIVSSFASMIAVLMLTTSKDQAVHDHVLMVPAAIASMILAWFMVHTQYVFHYAHEYYDQDDREENFQQGGLQFPEDDAPNYLDFAYFSFCMGCTYQVSDVSVTSKLLRKIVMVHGLISFFINTFIVALTINMVASFQ